MSDYLEGTYADTAGTYAAPEVQRKITLEMIQRDCAELARLLPAPIPPVRVIPSRWAPKGIHYAGDGIFLADPDSFETLRTQLAFDAWMRREGAA